jgi:putative transposase
MISFIDDRREKHEIEPICKLLPIALSPHFMRKARQRDRARRSARARRDAGLAE